MTFNKKKGHVLSARRVGRGKWDGARKWGEPRPGTSRLRSYVGAERGCRRGQLVRARLPKGSGWGRARRTASGPCPWARQRLLPCAREGLSLHHRSVGSSPVVATSHPTCRARAFTATSRRNHTRSCVKRCRIRLPAAPASELCRLTALRGLRAPPTTWPVSTRCAAVFTRSKASVVCLQYLPATPPAAAAARLPAECAVRNYKQKGRRPLPLDDDRRVCRDASIASPLPAEYKGRSC